MWTCLNNCHFSTTIKNTFHITTLFLSGGIMKRSKIKRNDHPFPQVANLTVHIAGGVTLWGYFLPYKILDIQRCSMAYTSCCTIHTEYAPYSQWHHIIKAHPAIAREHLSLHRLAEVPPFLSLCVLIEHRGIPGETSFITVGKMGHAACMRAGEGKHAVHAPWCVEAAGGCMPALGWACTYSRPHSTRVRLKMVVFSALRCPDEVPE